MRVRVDKTRQYDTTGGIQPGLVRVLCQQVGGPARGYDLIILKENSPVFDQTKCSKSITSLRGATNGQKLGGRVDEHGDI
jgi:hypothetical protein